MNVDIAVDCDVLLSIFKGDIHVCIHLRLQNRMRLTFSGRLIELCVTW